MTNEELFYKEFNLMLGALKGRFGTFGLYALPIPFNCNTKYLDLVHIENIEDEYYSKLNGTDAIQLSGKIYKRKFDYKGDFITDKSGGYVTEQIVVPRTAIAIASKEKLGVPLKYKPSEEEFCYVDMKKNFYIYIVPKKYCYKINHAALVMSYTRLKAYYEGYSITLKNGCLVYLYVVPYKNTLQNKGYRILSIKPDSNFSNELNLLKQYWVTNGYMFNPDLCVLNEGIKGRENLAYECFSPTLDCYIKYDEFKSLQGEEEFDIEIE